MRAKPGALSQDRLELEGRALIGVELRLEVLRREDPPRDEVLPKVGDEVGLLQGGQDAVGVLLLDRVPVLPAAKVRHGAEDVEGLATRRCEARVGAGRGVEVQREVLGDDLAVEDIPQQPFVTRAEDDRMMRQVRIRAIGAEVDDEQRHREPHPLQSAVGPRPAVFGFDELAVRVGDVAVGDDNTYRKLVKPEHRRTWTDRRLERMRFAMSLFVVYFGTDRTYPHLPHHAIVLGPRYEGLLRDIFDRKVVAEDFSLYLHTPTRTDRASHRLVARPSTSSAPCRTLAAGRTGMRFRRSTPIASWPPWRKPTSSPTCGSTSSRGGSSRRRTSRRSSTPTRARPSSSSRS